MVLESSLEAFFRSRVRAVGGYVIKMAPVERGVPDRLVILPPGTLHIVELKTTTGSLSPIQRHWHARLAARGVRVTTLAGRAEILEWVRNMTDGARPECPRCAADPGVASTPATPPTEEN